MRSAEAIIAEVLPFFARFGTLEGQAAAAEVHAWTSNALNCHFHERLCYVRILQGDAAGALTAAEAAERTARNDGATART